MKKILTLLSFLLLTQNTFAFEITNKNINDLKFGKTNPTVKELQFFLNENGFYESEEGPGSPDNETEYFGNATVASVKIFQEYSELPITGNIDLTTGKAINSYIKEIEEEEIETESGNYSDEEKSYFSKDTETAENRYNLGDEMNTPIDDITDIYLNKSNSVSKNNSDNLYGDNVSSENKKWSLKDLLEGAHKKSASASADPEKQKTIFQRFFSIFE